MHGISRLLAAALLPAAFASLAVIADADIPLYIGAGCNYSDYASLPTATSVDDGPAAFHLQYDGGHGRGLYVVHVSQFNLPRNDVVVIRSNDASANKTLTQKLFGRNTTGSFYSKPIAGDGIVVELFKSADKSGDSDPETECVGFAIDAVRFTPQTEAAKVAVGDETSLAALKALPPPSNTSKTTSTEINESLCGQDESQEAVCYESGLVGGGAAMYAASKPVARLVIRKDNNMNIAYCTGFLLGCEGHLVTNQHCIRDWIDALNTGVEFFAEATQCGTQSCEDRAACPGRIRVSSTALVAVSTQYDYALVKLTPDDGSPVDTLLSQVGGYLQLRSNGAKMDETIYVPQYPMGYGKRIASTNNGAPGRVESLSVTTCGGSDVGYYVDTQEGSSGSPVLAVSDNLVVALHHCGGCLNGGIPSQQLIADMQQRGVLPKCAVA